MIFVCERCGKGSEGKCCGRNPVRRYCSRKCYRATRPEYLRLWREHNRGRVNESNRKSYYKHRQQRIDRQVAYRTRRYRADPKAAMTMRLRARLTEVLKIGKARKAATFYVLTGCTQRELYAHIESTFQPGMTWENRHLWHVDHKIPCFAFDLTDPAQQAQCFHFSNLQALWATANMKKARQSLRGFYQQSIPGGELRETETYNER